MALQRDKWFLVRETGQVSLATVDIQVRIGRLTVPTGRAVRLNCYSHEVVVMSKSCVYFQQAADLTALSVVIEVVGRKEAAIVSATVTSQVSQRPTRHRISVRSSGGLPSVPTMTAGSTVVSIEP